MVFKRDETERKNERGAGGANKKIADMKPNRSFTDNVYKRLIDLPMGESITFNPDRGTQELWDKFIVAVKRYINDNFYHPDHTIQISSDYLSIKKITADYFPTEKQQP